MIVAGTVLADAASAHAQAPFAGPERPIATELRTTKRPRSVSVA
jgi:hypothetical protein